MISTPTLPPLTEADFLEQVTQLATLLGWSYLHLRPAMTRDSWRTPISGPLGKGWPDLVLIRERDHRLIFAELKRDKAEPTPAQVDVLQRLSEVAAEVFLWRPVDWPQVERTLR
jgi:hypothetical protein